MNWILAESDLAAVGSRRMLFPNCDAMPGSQEMSLSRDPSGVTDLGLGLQSLRLSGWDKPWSSQEADTHTSPSRIQTSSPSSKCQTLNCVIGFCVIWDTSFPKFFLALTFKEKSGMNIVRLFLLCSSC